MLHRPVELAALTGQVPWAQSVRSGGVQRIPACTQHALGGDLPLGWARSWRGGWSLGPAFRGLRRVPPVLLGFRRSCSQGYGQNFVRRWPGLFRGHRRARQGFKRGRFDLLWFRWLTYRPVAVIEAFVDERLNFPCAVDYVTPVAREVDSFQTPCGQSIGI